MVNELHAVVEELGGEPVLGRSFRTATDLQSAIREGFPQTVVEEVMHAAGLTLKELAASLDLSARSLQRRRGRLARYESDRLYRLARIVAFLAGVLGKANRRPAFRITVTEKLGQLAMLAVGHSVHGVDDDGLNSLA